MNPSPIYTLLTVPAGWMKAPTMSIVVDSVLSGAWEVDPNEKPEGMKPLTEAMMAAFDELSFGTHQQGNEAFKRLVPFLFEAGAKVNLPVRAGRFSRESERWWTKVSRAGSPWVPALSRVEEAVEALHDGQPKLKALRQWSRETGMTWDTELGGFSLLFHLTAEACSKALGWVGDDARSGKDDGWVTHGRGSNTDNLIHGNRASTAQRVDDVVAIHEWLGLLDPMAPSQNLALWWLMAWPLSKTPKGTLKEEKWKEFSDLYKSVSASPRLLQGLEAVIHEKPWGYWNKAMAELVLAAVPALPLKVGAKQAWDWAFEAFGRLPASQRGAWSKSSFSDDQWQGKNVRNALNEVALRFGWPSVEWAEEKGVQPEALTEVWLCILQSGASDVSGATEIGVQWKQWSVENPKVEWPSESSLQTFSDPRGERVKTWYHHSELSVKLSPGSGNVRKVRI